jgi:nitrate/nitrite transporter NarK
VPRVLNVALAVLLLLLVAPIVTNFGGKRVYVQVVLVLVTVPVVALALACLASAARPGSLGRAVRRRRQVRR